jgi:serine/threonine-protein kinase
MQFTQLGPYRIGRRLGRGGMGTVFAGENVETGQAAAVKILSPHLADDPGFRERFEGEIETLKKLRHPNIVELFGWGEEDGHLFYAMELVDGTNLEQELARGRRFSWRETTQIALALCKALKHAHDRGVIHRDIKPANLLLAPDGVVKLSDFGIAKLFGNSGMTMDGGVLGTAEYMSPEQAEGKTVTSRCDLYSLGGVIYALLAGKSPFQARSLPEMLHLQRTAVPDSIQRYAPDTPDELDRIISQLLEKDPARRIPNALVLARRLEAMVRALSIPKRTDGGMSDTVEGAILELEDDAETPGTKLPHQPTVLSGGNNPLGATQIDAASQARLSQAQAAQSSQDIDLEYSIAGSITDPSERADAPRVPTGHDVPLSQPASKSRKQSAVPAEAPSNEPAEPRTRFVTRQEIEGADEEVSTATPWFQVAGIAAIIALIVALTGYALRPSSPDQLYEQLAAAAAVGPERLAEIQDVSTEFLHRFPDDARAVDVQTWHQEGEQARESRRLLLRARHGGKQSYHPSEQSYLDAERLAGSNPAQALSRFQSLVELFDSDEAAQDIVGLARQRIAELTPRVETLNEPFQQALNARLEEARSLQSTDPRAARAMLLAIIELYDDAPWANSTVERARQELTTVNAP